MPAMQEMQVRFLDWEDLLERERATHSSILAWEIPWSEELGGLQSMRTQHGLGIWEPTWTFLVTCTSSPALNSSDG